MSKFQVMVWNGVGYNEDIVLARSFSISDGHLFFWSNSADRCCAAFAEGFWRSVEILEKEEEEFSVERADVDQKSFLER